MIGREDDGDGVVGGETDEMLRKVWCVCTEDSPLLHVARIERDNVALCGNWSAVGRVKSLRK